VQKPRILDMFSGIGGFSLGLERAGMTTVRFIEQNKFCQAVLAKHWPEVPCDEDVTTAEFSPGEADIIVGGFPCQDVSRAGKRAGITGERSGLYREMVRALRVVRPKHAIMENVAELLGDGLDVVLGDLAEIRYDAEWDCISADNVGAPHGRDRVWIAASDADQFERAPGRDSGAGRRIGFQSKIEEAGNADCVRKLQPPRLLGYIRRRVADATCSGDWWSCDWQTKFAALRGMDDGVSSRLDRSANAAAIKSLGNSLLPQIPEIIGEAMLQFF